MKPARTGLSTLRMRKHERGHLSVTFLHHERRFQEQTDRPHMNFSNLWSNRLTLWVALEFKCWRLGPPLQRKVGHLSSALTQQHTSPTKQDLLQLKTAGQKLHVILQPHFRRSKGTHLSLWDTYFHMHTLKVLIYDLMQTPTSSSSLPSFSPHCSAGEPALTWLTNIPVWLPPMMVMSSARLGLLCFGEVGGLGDGEQCRFLRDGRRLSEAVRMKLHNTSLWRHSLCFGATFVLFTLCCTLWQKIALI